jgi:nicotinamidase-related amidase
MLAVNSSMPRTLLAMAGVSQSLPSFEKTPLVLIDYQNEYLRGELALPGARAAILAARKLLDHARSKGTRIVHIAHKGSRGGMFDRDDHRGAFIDELSPVHGETVIEKPKPNSFAGTELSEILGPSGQQVIFAGLMTHMCVSSTVRAALDLGYISTIVADACATRDLPHLVKGFVPHHVLHDAELAALADRFAQIVMTEEML